MHPRTHRPLLAESVRLTDDGVDILDRRVYPFERTWVHCTCLEDVAVAIETMVTQSSGPLFATTAGLVLAAREAAGLGPADAVSHLRAAGRRLVATRPTNNAIRDAVAATLEPVAEAEERGLDGAQLLPLVTAAAGAHEMLYRDRSVAMGAHAAALLPERATVLTHCWADWYLVATVEAAQAAGKELRFVCTETRPYLQGARLTAPTLVEMGYRPTLITDGMVAATMARGMVDLVLVAADRVTMDGHVVNKVGTLQAALAARAHDLPFVAMVHAPDPHAPTIADVEMEERDGEEVLHVAGRRTAPEGITGFYPAFDATPPDSRHPHRHRSWGLRAGAHRRPLRDGGHAVSSNGTRRIVVDTDTGIDDAHTLLYLAGRPDASIEAITSVYGNCTQDDSLRNITYVQQLLGLDVPLARGADGPLEGEPRIAWQVHGRDGLGDRGYQRPEPHLVDETAAEVLVRLGRESPGSWTCSPWARSPTWRSPCGWTRRRWRGTAPSSSWAVPARSRRPARCGWSTRTSTTIPWRRRRCSPLPAANSSWSASTSPPPP